MFQKNQSDGCIEIHMMERRNNLVLRQPGFTVISDFTPYKFYGVTGLSAVGPTWTETFDYSDYYDCT